MKKRITKILALGAALCLLVGSFAFFTDRLTADSSAKAGTIDLVWEDTSLAIGSNNDFAIDKVWDTADGLVTAGKVINPGDYFDLSYKLTNAGNKSIDVRQRIILTSSEELTSLDAAEYKLTITGGKDETAVTGTLQADNKTIIYDLKDIILDGSIETEADAVSGAYTVRLDFAKAAKNAFMDSTVTVNLYAAAKQHRNTEGGDFPEFTEMANIMSNSGWETK